MQKEFESLTIEEQRKFLIKSILNDNYFHNIHKSIKDSYIEYIYDKDELKNKLKERNNRRMGNIIRNNLKYYTNSVNKCFIEQSRYKDIVDEVYSCKQEIELNCASKFINDITDSYGEYKKHIFEEIIYSYERTLNTISGYGGNTRGSDDQTLKKAIKILLKNPYLNADVKNTQKYKDYYNEFININKLENDESSDLYFSSEDDEAEYNDNEKDIESSISSDNKNENESGENESDENYSDGSM
jgi:hypothetical protein